MQLSIGDDGYRSHRRADLFAGRPGDRGHGGNQASGCIIHGIEKTGMLYEETTGRLRVPPRRATGSQRIREHINVGAILVVVDGYDFATPMQCLAPQFLDPFGGERRWYVRVDSLRIQHRLLRARSEEYAG